MLIFYFKKLTAWLRHNRLDLILILFILGLGIFVAFRNYVPGTWLIGWDSLMPELNLKLNIARSLSSVWQEYQGLGLLGGMAHAADLPRQLILAVFSLVIPASFLRYFWAFLMLVAGPLGIYLLISRALIVKSGLGKIAGLASAVFYLFNLATLQIFYTPYETFVSFYGFFPWLLYLALNFLKNGEKKRLFIYFLVSVAAASAFYVQTLFVVYSIALLVFAFETIIREGKTGIGRALKLGFVTLLANAFWLLPALYFTATSAGIPANSHINSIATPETTLMNQARADFTDIVTLKGYWFDYYDLGAGQKYDYLYKTWIDYTGQPVVADTSLALFVVSVAGLILSFFRKKISYGASLLILFGISCFMLAGGQIPWIPFFGDIFRNAYTKWSNVQALIYAVGVGFFVYFSAGVIKGKLKYLLGSLITLAVVIAAIFAARPILSGNLISDSMRLAVPSYYLDAVDYFKAQDPTRRIADFPLTDFWGWKFNDWGYRGSGFLWYGIPQPMLDRTFDVWSPLNEAFYNEARHAVESNSPGELKYVLNKYQVSYILFDGSVFMPGSSDSEKLLQKEKDLLESSNYIAKVKEFGKLAVYKVNLSDSPGSFITAPKNNFSLTAITVGLRGSLAQSEMFPATQGYQTPKNCDLKNLGSVAKNRIGGGVDYVAQGGGVSCDYFYYPGLDYSKAYLLRVTGKNVTGRSLKIYLYNAGTRNMDLEELLPAGNFDKTFLVLPTTSVRTVGEGYTLNIETRSFGNVKSENIIRGIQFYNLNYAYSVDPVPVSNNLIVKSVQKYGTWAYKVDVQDSGVIQLGQGFEDGWTAFAFDSRELTITFPAHFRLNSWANGWTVPEGTSTVYLIYWPQLLEWGGMVLGLGLTGLLFRLY